jgi:hypothetical protein
VTPRLKSWLGLNYCAAPLTSHDQLGEKLNEYQYLGVARRVWFETSFLRVARVIEPFTFPAVGELLKDLLRIGGIYNAQIGARGSVVRRYDIDPEVVREMRKQSHTRLDSLSEDYNV